MSLFIFGNQPRKFVDFYEIRHWHMVVIKKNIRINRHEKRREETGWGMEWFRQQYFPHRALTNPIGSYVVNIVRKRALCCWLGRVNTPTLLRNKCGLPREGNDFTAHSWRACHSEKRDVDSTFSCPPTQFYTIIFWNLLGGESLSVWKWE